MSNHIVYVLDLPAECQCVIGTRCPLCGIRSPNLKVTEEGWHNWRNRGMLIQEAFPELTSSERELLQTGICDDCWAKTMGDE